MDASSNPRRRPPTLFSRVFSATTEQIFSAAVDRIALQGSAGAFLHHVVLAIKPDAPQRVINYLLRQFRARPTLFTVTDKVCGEENESEGQTQRVAEKDTAQVQVEGPSKPDADPAVAPVEGDTDEIQPAHQTRTVDQQSNIDQTNNANIDQTNETNIDQTNNAPAAPVVTYPHIIACIKLQHRALGVNSIEHPPLPPPSWKIMYVLGKAGLHGVYQSDLSPIIGLKSNMVHHYVCFLSARQLIARRRVSVRSQKRTPQVPTDAFPDTAQPSTSATNVVSTSIIVLARYANRIHESIPISTTTILDDSADIRMSRVVDLLSKPPYIRAEKELKSLAIPDSDRPANVTREFFNRKRHRSYRSIRTKLLRLGYIKVVQRDCVNKGGRELGIFPCIKLTESALRTLAGEREVVKKKLTHPLLIKEGTGKMLAEVDITEQVFRVIKKSGTTGIAVPEIRDYLDNQGVTSAVAKRVRTTINAISKKQPTVERQYFEGSAMYMRISLKGDGDEPPTKRRKVGLTSLGERRQELLMQLLRERKVVVRDTLGREIASREEGNLVRVDPKVMKRILDDLVVQKKIKIIKTTRPSIKDNRRHQMVALAALPDVKERGEEVKNLITTLVNKSLYGSSDRKETSSSAANNDPSVRFVTTGRGRRAVKLLDYDAAEIVVIEDESEDSDEDTAGKGTPASDAGGADEIQAEDADSSTKKKRKRTTTNGDDKAALVKRRRSRKTKQTDAESAEKETASRKGRNGRAYKTKKQKRIALEKAREYRNIRLGRLRALDNGYLKGKMSRARRFHQNLYGIVSADIESSVTVSDAVHVTVADAKKAGILKKFTMAWFLKELTVGEYAATIGTMLEHGDTIRTLENRRIGEVYDHVADELESAHAGRNIQQILQVLSKLDLIRCDVDSQWILSGAGVIRNFGKGVPAGIEPHGILFSSRAAVDEYWRELEQFSQCSMSRKGPSIDLLSEGKRRLIPDERSETNVYFPIRWLTGLRQLSKKEQLNFETLLQRLCGTEVQTEGGDEMVTDKFIKHALPWFTVQEIFEAFEKHTAGLPRKGQLHQQERSLEKLLLYSRYRSKNDIPRFVNKTADPGGSRKGKDQVRDNSSILQLSRTPSAIYAYQVRAGLPTVHNFHAKGTPLPFARRKERKEARVDVKKLLPLIGAVVKARSRGYYLNDADELDWKIVLNFIRGHLGSGQKELAEVIETENLRRTIATLCEMHVIRVAVDVLSLKLVLEIQKVAQERGITETGVWSSHELILVSNRILKDWAAFNSAVVGLLFEVRDDIFHHANIVLVMEDFLKVCTRKMYRSKLEVEFGLIGFRIGREMELQKMLGTMAKRYRWITDLRLRGGNQHPVLLSPVHGEVQKTHQAVSQAHDLRDTNDENCGEEKEKDAVEKGAKAAMNNHTAEKSVGKDQGDNGSTETHISRPKQASGVAELVIASVCRQEAHLQWNDTNKKLLSNFRSSDLADARDRMLLRGAIVYGGGGGGTRGYLVARRGERPQDKSGVPILMETTGDEQLGWMKNAREEKEGLFEKTALWKSIVAQSDESTRALTFAATLAVHGDLDIIPELMKFGEDEDVVMGDLNDEVVRLHFKYNRVEGEPTKHVLEHMDVDSTVGTEGGLTKETEDVSSSGSKVVSAEVEALCRRIEDGIGDKGQDGITLTELLTLINPKTKDEKQEMIAALSHLLSMGMIYRFAVETDEAELGAASGILYALQKDSIRHTTWRTASGQVDSQLMRGVGETALQVMMRDAGVDINVILKTCSNRHECVPRRAIADLVLGMKEVVRLQVAFQNGTDWRLHTCKDPFIDALAIESYQLKRRIALFPCSALAHTFDMAHNKYGKQWNERIHA